MIKVGKILGIRRFLGDFFDFFAFVDFFVDFFVGDFGSSSEHSDFLGWGFWEHSEQLGALGFWRRWWGLGFGGGWR